MDILIRGKSISKHSFDSNNCPPTNKIEGHRWLYMVIVILRDISVYQYCTIISYSVDYDQERGLTQ